MAQRAFQFKRTFQLLLAILLLAPALHAANDPFTGKWKLNPAQSRLIDVMKVEAAGPNKYHFIFSGDNVESIVIDGTNQTALFGSTLAVSAENDRSWKVVRKTKGRITIVGLWKLSEDGNSLTDNFTSYRPDGSTSNVVYLYKRTAGSSGFAGTWEGSAEQLNSTYEIEIKPYQETGFSLVYPAFDLNKSMKLDDKDYPNTGSASVPGLTSSAHRINERALQMTNKINGKVADTLRIELSSDSKILTMTDTIPGHSQPNIMVFDRQ